MVIKGVFIRHEDLNINHIFPNAENDPPLHQKHPIKCLWSERIHKLEGFGLSTEQSFLSILAIRWYRESLRQKATQAFRRNRESWLPVSI